MGGWSGSAGYRRIGSRLAASEDREFERQVLELIRTIWPDAIIPPAMRRLDRSGVDIVVWSDASPFPLAVQCKGFRVTDEEIGKRQVDQCLKSIAQFRASGLKAHFYLLIHNRTNKDPAFRASIEEALQRLVQSKQVDRAELWDRRRFLQELFENMRQLLLLAIDKNRLKRERTYSDRQICEPLEEVPYNISTLSVDVNHLVNQSIPTHQHGDPSKDLLDPNVSNLRLVIGGAGYGKTTAALRALRAADQLVLYVPAATIPGRVNATDALLMHCVTLCGLYDEMLNANPELFDSLIRPAVRSVFRNERTPVMLIFDALDESVYFSRRGGLQLLFNQLRRIAVPVILTARTEFWRQRELDFAAIYGDIAHVKDPERRRVKMLELMPWQNNDIALLANRFRNTLTDTNQQTRLSEFISLIEKDEYDLIYGDIPRRPLFLRFILETVADQGVQRTSRAKLFYEWAQAKIMRDISRPMQWGNAGRPAILSEGEPAAITLRLAFRAMMLAAFRMTRRIDASLELLPTCPLDSVLLSDERLKGVVDPVGLFLNSLLVPEPFNLGHEDVKVKFAHRAYQEFFLALFLRESAANMKNMKVPDAVLNHIADLSDEGFETS